MLFRRYKSHRYCFRKPGTHDPRLIVDSDLPKIDTFYQPAYRMPECLRGIP